MDSHAFARRGSLRTNFLLIDYENVQPRNVDALNGGCFKVRLFLGPHQTKVPLELARSLHAFGLDAQYVESGRGGKNALDLHIAYYIGRLAVEHPGAFFHIVSKDKDFGPLIKHLKSQNIFCQRADSVERILLVRLLKAKSIPEKVDAVIEVFARNASCRPKSDKKLGKTISGWFQGQLCEEDLRKVVDELSRRKFIEVTDGKVAYRLDAA